MRVTIPFAFELEDDTQDVGVNVGVNEQQLLTLIEKDCCLTASSAAEILSITKRQAERLFSSLKEKNIIRRIGADKNGHWEIIKI